METNLIQQKAEFELLHGFAKEGTLPSLLIESSDDAITTKTLDGIITSWNRGAEKIYGYTEAEIIGKNINILIPPNQPNELDELLKQISSGCYIPHYEIKRIRKDGVIIDSSLALSAIKDEAGKIIGVATVSRDISGRSQASQYARSLIEASLDPLVTISPKGKITDVNEATIKITGLVRENLIGTDFSDYFTEPEKAREGYKQVFEKGLVADYPLTIHHTNGKLIDVLYNASVYKDEKGNVLGVFAAARDITAQKQASQYARSLIEASLDPLVTISVEGKITDVNEASVKVTGIEREKLIGTDFSDYFTEAEKAREGYKQVFEKGFISDYPLTVHNKNGKLIDVLYNASVYKDNKGNVLGVFAAARDITAQKQASQYARSLIEASLDPLVTISVEGKITDVNEASVKVTGVEREKLIGTDFSDYFTEPEKARDGYKQVFEKGFVADYPLTIRHKSEKLTNVLYNASVYKDNKGKVLGVFAAARDITAQKQASQYARSLIEASLDPLVTISVEGKITDVNEASVKVTGVERGKLIGTDFSDYFTEPEKAREGYKQVFEKGFVADYPLTIRHKSEKLTDVLYNASVYKDNKGNVLGIFAAARDITAQKNYAEELTLKNEELVKAKELAENLSNVKDQFLASMSHEIRTPLNGIIGFTKILLRNGITDSQKPQLEAIKTSSDILLVLINDILDLAKIEAGKMTFESTELKLSDLVNSILGTFELRFQEKEIKINKSYDNRIPTILVGDPVRINQILLNLLSNSVKFTKQGGQISIGVNLLGEDEENTNIELSVSDTGIGIPAEKLDLIFEPFTQSSNDTARKYGGTGLGLSIVKRLVDLMGGTISVKSEINTGSTFTITLPLKKTTSKEITKEIEKGVHVDELKKLGKIKILLVEDIPINQFLAQTILHDFGFESDTAENGKIAIELLEKNDYDIILMDLMMPEMNGFEATQYIRSKMLPPKSLIPIIALTADVTKTDVDKSEEVGMNEYVSKPINETDLLNKITLLVKNTRSTMQARTIETVEKKKICNLDYLKSHSPNNPKFVKEMVGMILKQSPGYISDIKKCLANADWNGFFGNVHKIRPTIDLIGMPKEIGIIAKQMEEYGKGQVHLDLIPLMFLKIENAFKAAYIELEKELEEELEK